MKHILAILVFGFSAVLVGCGDTAQGGQPPAASVAALTATQPNPAAAQPTSAPPLDLSSIQSFSDYQQFKDAAFADYLKSKDQATHDWVKTKDACNHESYEATERLLQDFARVDRPNYLEWLDAERRSDFGKMEALRKTSRAAARFRNLSRQPLGCEAEVAAAWNRLQKVSRDGYADYKTKDQAAYKAYQDYEAAHRAPIGMP